MGIMCGADGEGQFDRESNTPANYFRYARDVAGLDIVALTDHVPVLNEESLQTILDEAERWNEPGRFVALGGYEWERIGAQALGERVGDHTPVVKHGIPRPRPTARSRPAWPRESESVLSAKATATTASPAADPSPPFGRSASTASPSLTRCAAAAAGSTVDLHARIVGTKPIARVEFVAAWKGAGNPFPTLQAWAPGRQEVDLHEDVFFPGRGGFGYLRILQEDGHRAWSSPVWLGE